MTKHTFQSIIIQLQEYWASRGCLIWQPYYTQVGAGTMNPATFLRVLGPEPWSVAYVEPSVRPDDGRYGENPNRLQMHYQYQVILKPDTGNPQELYLDSLKAIGIDPRQHDIRFVEDNWEQPAISAWGLGWEVWLDGQEITQFTYFQQVGGVALDPVAVEITYGLDRILIALNNAKGIWDEPWGNDITYGEVRRREEFEHSKYYYEVADVARARQMYELYLAESEACLAQGLVLPAHDYVLKSSHTFNILDARGAVSLTERQASFGKMRDLARKVALAYLEQRKELEYPLLKETGEQRTESSPKPSSSLISTPQSLLLEIGVEELPANDVDHALNQLREKVPAWLADLRLEHGPVTVHATPRRLAVFVEALSPGQPDREDLVKGPPADRAFDSAGMATPAAMGFAKKNGVDVSALQVREIDGGKYVTAVVSSKSRPTPEVLAEALPGLVAGISFVKTMRWNASGVAFSRPIRWFVSLLGEQVIPFEYAGVLAGNVSRGLRPYDSPDIAVASADSYFDTIRDAGITLDIEERKAAIVEMVKKAAASVGGEAIIEPGLLSEVANLIEKPTAVLGGFNPDFLGLPRDVLIGTMKKHQRYFPIRAVGAQHAAPLLPYFIAIRNGDAEHLEIVKEGNEHVLGARFADANFFVREDVKFPLENYRDGLKTLTFQTKLGSVLDKSERMLKLSAEIAEMLGLDDVQRSNVQRATFLAKADLTTQMVTEMTSLQGIIGREYALRTGEKAEVALAIGEQYQPVPQSKIGLVVALADRIDSLVGLFAAGLAPTGAKDPFGLRRAAIGTVQPLIEHDLDFDLRAAIEKSAAAQPIPVSAEVQAQVLEFLTGRMRVLLTETGFRFDVVEAVLAVQSRNPAASARAMKQLSEWVKRPDWAPILDGYARCVRITRSAGMNSDQLLVSTEKLVEPAEKMLYESLQTLNVQPATVNEFLQTVEKLIPAITGFFDKVLVMAEDQAVKQNRLALVGQIANLSAGIADLSKLEGF
ncbi:MAG: glycine--tRNA ligase subunit alpha/beta [Chloroflexi bacterium HGW-Chloroflexi-6]|nr:MAG: glycine--tRNA ligase subunit alpha/beta [Chloroflexi bacterium HGW-Chloroflexi-6]